MRDFYVHAMSGVMRVVEVRQNGLSDSFVVRGSTVTAGMGRLGSLLLVRWSSLRALGFLSTCACHDEKQAQERKGGESEKWLHICDLLRSSDGADVGAQ